MSVGSAEDTLEVNVDTSQMEPLLILEEGDEPLGGTNGGQRGRTVLRLKTENKTSDMGEAEGRGSSRHHNDVREEKSERTVTEAEVNEETSANLEAQKANDHMGRDDEPTLRPKDTLSPGDATLTGHRLSPDFPEALCELLYTLQEGRRLNDQRCSFRLDRRRRCYSEPSTPRHSHRVLFSSMTSLQREEFFDLLATSQARRLDDQRAELQNRPAPVAPAAKPKSRSSSRRIPELRRAASAQTPNEDLYNMIVSTQAQGRLEEQRSAAPGPMDDEDFFSLLLKVQGGRMDEQRTELKPGH